MQRPWLAQAGFDVRFEWGPPGIEALGGQVVVVVDVLRFTTAVDVAVGRGARVVPWRWQDASAAAHAARIGAEVADGRQGTRLSLSPVSLLALEPGATVVLPSPNGSTCAVLAADAGATVVAACLRNAGAVARWLSARSGPVTVIGCGERWPDGSLRPSFEDHVGAGAVVAGLTGRPSPEAGAAAAAWHDAAPQLAAAVRSCVSGRELSTRGWDADLDHALAVDASRCVPVLRGGAFVDASKAG